MRLRTRRSFVRRVALAFAAVAVLAPTAQAQFTSREDAGPIVKAPAPIQAPVSKPSGGFSWADAAVGAGGAISLMALAGGASIAIRRRNSAIAGAKPASA